MKLFLTTFALSVFCISATLGESEVNTRSSCRINGERINEGETVGRRLDGCNNCFCSSYGFGCTLMACPWYEALDCEFEGQHYNHYDVIPSEDCGDCRCMNGNLACTNCPA
ncbi:unnamed protein product [Lymnaea stagnalis]|uniref:Uncharacterized protein n=1 Tax=Lymnaea stagnalis TaxID=6523 RepID=A0AAV2IE58_LYMST